MVKTGMRMEARKRSIREFLDSAERGIQGENGEISLEYRLYLRFIEKLEASRSHAELESLLSLIEISLRRTQEESFDDLLVTDR
jgi:hypothetical protein